MPPAPNAPSRTISLGGADIRFRTKKGAATAALVPLVRNSRRVLLTNVCMNLHYASTGAPRRRDPHPSSHRSPRSSDMPEIARRKSDLHRADHVSNRLNALAVGILQISVRKDGIQRQHRTHIQPDPKITLTVAQERIPFADVRISAERL